MMQNLLFSASSVIEGSIKQHLPNILSEEGKPSWMKAIKLEHFKIGDEAPHITSIRVDEVSIQDEGAGMHIEVSLSWHSSMDIQLVAVTALGGLSVRLQVT